MAMIAVKNPQRREAARRSMEELGKQMMRLALANRTRWEGQVRQMKAAGVMAADEPADYSGMRAFLESDEYSIGMATEAHLGVELKSLGLMTRLLSRRQWSVMRAPQGSTGFVTCDHPVGLGWTDGNEGFYQPGFGLSGTTITFPVSKEVALLGQFENRAKAAGVEFTAHHVTAYLVDDAIVEEAEKLSCDMIVIVTHGRSKLGKFIFGSHTKNVIVKSKLPVLVLR